MNPARTQLDLAALMLNPTEQEAHGERAECVEFLVPIETAEKIRTLCEKELARCFTPCRACGVPNSPDTDKELLGIRIERTLKARVVRAAAAQGLTITEFVRQLLVSATANVTLTSSDYAKIAAQVEKAENQLSRKLGK